MMWKTFIEPPAAGDETDEDSADKVNNFRGKIYKISGKQLQAAADTVLQSGKRISGQNYDQHPGNEKASAR